MTPRKRGILLAVLQVWLVAALGVKFVLDRYRYPHVWAQTAPYDPYMPIRGRYVSLRLRVKAEDDSPGYKHRVVLKVADDQLVAERNERGTVSVVKEGIPGRQLDQLLRPPGERDASRPSGWVLREPIVFFIPEHAADPSRREPGEELWAEVTAPPKGPPRPIRLGIKKNGVITELPFN